jgi:hypothetical protein
MKNTVTILLYCKIGKTTAYASANSTTVVGTARIQTNTYDFWLQFFQVFLVNNNSHSTLQLQVIATITGP